MTLVGTSFADANGRHRPRILAAAMAAFCLTPFGQARAQTEPQAPAILFDPFYARAALAGITPDGKQLADAVPKAPPPEIMATYRRERPRSPDALRAFFQRYFEPDSGAAGNRQPTKGLPLQQHIAELWPLLTRETARSSPYSSLLALPNPYIVPGGRFTEIYYWDSYFTMLGFGPRQADLQRGMVDNFASLISTYGHIPNGNRSY